MLLGGAWDRALIDLRPTGDVTLPEARFLPNGLSGWRDAGNLAPECGSDRSAGGRIGHGARLLCLMPRACTPQWKPGLAGNGAAHPLHGPQWKLRAFYHKIKAGSSVSSTVYPFIVLSYEK